MAMVHTVIDFSALMKFVLTRELMSDGDQLFLVLFLNNRTLFPRLALHRIFPVVGRAASSFYPLRYHPSLGCWVYPDKVCDWYNLES